MPHATPSPDATVPTAPFFVVGADRSGTTLLRVMLNRHRRLHIPRESWFLIDLMDTLPQAGALGPAEVERAATLIVAHPRWPDWEIPDATLRAALGALEHPTLAALVDRLYRLAIAAHDKPRWGDKTPGYLAEMVRLAGLFPEAKFIHLIRDGRDVCLSLETHPWHGNFVTDNAHYWARAVAEGRAAGRALGPGCYLEIHYEDLVVQTESTLRTVCAFLGEAFEPAMLTFHETAADDVAEWEKTQRIHTKLERAPRPDDVERWRRESRRRQLILIEAIAGATLTAAGYQRALSGLPARVAVGVLGVLFRLNLVVLRLFKRLGLRKPPLRKWLRKNRA